MVLIYIFLKSKLLLIENINYNEIMVLTTLFEKLLFNKINEIKIFLPAITECKLEHHSSQERRNDGYKI